MSEINDTTLVKREIVFLGGLLHDIGKFWQRADKSLKDKANDLSGYSKRIAEDICPVNDEGRFGYQHVVWSNEFFERVSDKLNQIPGLKENIFAGVNSGENNLVNFAVNHHKPQTLYQAIISLADSWSAGIDRTNPSTLEKNEAENEPDINWGKKRYKSIPLYSIFNILNNGAYKNAFPLRPLNIDGSINIFPKAVSSKDDGTNEGEYHKLWNGFIEEFDKLPVDDIKAFTESLLFLLKKYTWCIPSNTMDMANVSLFEHLKTTASFADCLFEYHRQYPDDLQWNNVNKKLKVKDDVFPVLLVGGDISGIQKFIYNIASRKAAESLKGRSFYLQLLIDSFIHKIISHPDIGVTLGHVVYSSGGKFYVLLPNTTKVVNALDEIKKDIENFLWDEHKGKLVFNIDFVPFRYDNQRVSFADQRGVELGRLWKELADKLSSRKNKKFQTVISGRFDELFTPEKCGGERKVCAVTGVELLDKDKKELDKDVYVSNAVYQQIKLGRVLKDVDFAITFKGKSEDSKYLTSKSAFKHKHEVAEVGNYLFDQRELTDDDADFRYISSFDVSRVTRINTTDFIVPLKGNRVSYGFRFYGGNKQAQLQDGSRNKTFEEITQQTTGNKESDTYFAVLRMDVDGLGDVFINGLKENDKSFSAYATLSFLLDLFFSGYLNHIRNDFQDKSGKSKYKDWVNILYSGGDDVFAVGRWDKIIDFAEDIRKEFARFIGRDDISISAGITITGNKYPIAKAANMAGEAEDNAKKNEVNGSKNAICMFGEVISWTHEFDYVKELKDEFVSLLANEKMAKGILHKLMQFSALKKDNKDLSYKWHSVYYLKRFKDRYHENPSIRKFVDKLQKELFEPRKYDLIGLSARWAELYVREILNVEPETK